MEFSPVTVLAKLLPSLIWVQFLQRGLPHRLLPLKICCGGLIDALTKDLLGYGVVCRPPVVDLVTTISSFPRYVRWEGDDEKSYLIVVI